MRYRFSNIHTESINSVSRIHTNNSIHFQSVCPDSRTLEQTITNTADGTAKEHNIINISLTVNGMPDQRQQ